jgi:small ligand-binding sensory domain FIST
VENRESALRCGVLWASAVSQFPDSDRAAADACNGLREQLAGTDPDWLIAFVSAQHRDVMLGIGERLRSEFPGALLFGCNAQSVIGAGREIEEGPGLALVGAALPGVSLHPFHVPASRLPELPIPAESDFVLLADPFSAELDGILAQLDHAYPGRTKVGGVASGIREPGESLLYLADGQARAGIAGIALHGEIGIDSLVAQGCRPVGQPLFVTGAEGGVVHEIDGEAPVEILSRLFDAAGDARERALFQNSLFLGIAMRDAESEYGQGDYLIRNLVGADPETGALHVAAHLEERQVVQFHVRDAHTADADLAEHLERYAGLAPQPHGALLFSCLDRGRGLYGVADHDCDLFRQCLGRVPVGGFFCNGEIGPISGQTFLHGYTSAFALFRRPA